MHLQISWLRPRNLANPRCSRTNVLHVSTCRAQMYCIYPCISPLLRGAPLLSTCRAPTVMHTPASTHFLGDTSDIVTINVVRKGNRSGGCNRPLWSLRVWPTLYTCELVPWTWWTAAPEPAAQRAACSVAALGAAVWAGFEPRLGLRLCLCLCIWLRLWLCLWL